MSQQLFSTFFTPLIKTMYAHTHIYTYNIILHIIYKHNKNDMKIIFSSHFSDIINFIL